MIYQTNMVMWSSHLTAFDDFGNGMKMLFTKSGEFLHRCRLSGLSQL